MSTTTENDARKVLADLAGNREVDYLMRRLREVQKATEEGETWRTPLGRRVERAVGYLAMALEAAEGRLR
jgi:hypothetical protein